MCQCTIIIYVAGYLCACMPYSLGLAKVVLLNTVHTYIGLLYVIVTNPSLPLSILFPPFLRVDVTEAQFFIMFIHVVPGFFGTAFWKQEFLFGLELRLIIIAGCMVVLVWTLLQDFVDILKGGIGKNGSTCADTSVLSPGLPLLLTCYFTWSFVKHSEVVYGQWPSLVLMTLGLPVVKFTWLIVVSALGTLACVSYRLTWMLSNTITHTHTHTHTHTITHTHTCTHLYSSH